MTVPVPENTPITEPRGDSSAIQSPPRTVLAILRRLGPGLIIAGSIVGSGELVATTKTGAQAGHWLLWLIVIGCVIKVFTQVEFGRYAISSGTTTMAALNEVPGPRLWVSWVLWYWLVMFVVSLAQLGGIVHAVGQSLAMSLPITGDFNRLLDEQDAWDGQAQPIRQRIGRQEAPTIGSSNPRAGEAVPDDVGQGGPPGVSRPRPNWQTTDDIAWAAIVTLATIAILFDGRYNLIQSISTVLVAGFTLVTIFNFFALQSQPGWMVGWSDLRDGLSFRLPPAVEGLSRSPLATGLATFGIIGVGTTELIAYPYWCLEKGYGRFTGPRDESDQWAERARGWMRVMRWDAMVSMLVYTLATVAFYLLGASVLHRAGLDPNGNQLIRVLAQMYVPVFGVWAQWLFLFGAFAVLYSTFFVANASHARVAADAVRVFRAGAGTESRRIWWVRAFCVILPAFALLVCVLIRAPAELILASGVMQAIMLPMLAFATLYFRYRRCDPRICPGRLWDLLLWISSLGLFVAGGWTALSLLFPALERLGQSPPTSAAAIEAGETVEPVDLRGACGQMGEWLGRQIKPEGRVVLHPPFVIGGDFSSGELDRCYTERIVPLAGAIAAAYVSEPPCQPVVILLARSEASYRCFVQRLFGEEPGSSFGYYRPGLRMVVVNEGRGASGSRHELTHALVAADYPEMPEWLNEGIASLHEDSRLVDGVLVGHDNWRLAPLQDAIRQGQLQPLESLVRPGGFRNQRLGLSYAQARYLCLFMQEKGVLGECYRRLRGVARRGCEKTKTAPIFSQPRSGGSAAEAVAALLGHGAWRELDEDFRGWVLKRKMGDSNGDSGSHPHTAEHPQVPGQTGAG